MKEHPILFSTPMVQAILARRKSQTRRIIKPQPESVNHINHKIIPYSGSVEFLLNNIKCPYGQIGDILWVRETWNTLTAYESKPDYSVMNIMDFVYKADVDRIDKWKPSIFMPKEACRIRLEITNIRVERLLDISNSDAIAEGIECNNMNAPYPGRNYMTLWDRINGIGSAKTNPWVWVIEFKKL